jgi:maltooligosyltrehalose trehalohydrolase
MSQRIPDPTDRATFERSKIDWAETTRAPYQDFLSQTQQLLALRQSEIVPLLKSEYHGSHYTVSRANTLDVTWTFASGAIRLLANFGSSPMNESTGGATRVLWSSLELTPSGTDLHLPPWSGAILKGTTA